MNPTLETPTMATTACRDCGTSIMYETIPLMGHDLALMLHLRCDDCQRQMDEAAAAEAAARQAAEREARIERNVDLDMRETDVNHPRFNRALWEAVRQWRPARHGKGEFWLGLVGPADLSKTRCMALLAMKAMRAGVRATWTTANRLLDASLERKSGDRQLATLAREHLSDCLHAPWLFLDALGKNEWPAAFESQFFQILDHRKNNRLPLVYSSNAHPDQFSLVLSDLNREPIIGRLKDRTTLIHMRR
jgi:DNA replication protein DnaC